MGNIGPSRQHFDVLPIPSFGVEDADLWKLDTRPEPAPDARPAEADVPTRRRQPAR